MLLLHYIPMSTFYHVAPKELRDIIQAEGLRPSWAPGDGFATGSTPLQGTMARLHGVYLTTDPYQNVGVQREYDASTHDIWQVAVDPASLLPDFPALVEQGAYAEYDHLWFQDDHPLHDLYGDTIPYDGEPQEFIAVTGTGLHPDPVDPQQLRLVDGQNIA